MRKGCPVLQSLQLRQTAGKRSGPPPRTSQRMQWHRPTAYHMQRVTGDFRIVPVNGKVIGVLPSTLKSKALCVYFQIYSPLTHRPLSDCLLKTRVEFVAIARVECPNDSWGARKQWRQNCIETPLLESTRFSLKGVSRSAHKKHSAQYPRV